MRRKVSVTTVSRIDVRVQILVIQWLRKQYGISMTSRNSKLAVITRRPDCAGNPADEQTQLKEIPAAVERVKPCNFIIQVARY